MSKLVYKLVAFFLLIATCSAYADCVINAQMKQSYVVLDTHTIMLKGGVGNDIIIKTFAFINSSSQVTVLKDSFCSYENAVLYINGEVVDAQQVTNVRK